MTLELKILEIIKRLREEVRLTDQRVKQLAGGGGGGIPGEHNLGSHLDTEIENPSDGELIYWNENEGKWIIPKTSKSGKIKSLTYNKTQNGVTAYQGVCTDGTYLYTTTSSNVYKYDKSGNLLANRNIQNDTDYPHVGDLCYHDGFLYIGMSNGATSPPYYGCVLKLNASDLAKAAVIDTYNNHEAASVCRNPNDGSFLVSSYSGLTEETRIYQYNASWVYQEYFVLEDVDSDGGWAYDGIEWAGNYLYANPHEDSDLGGYLDVYCFKGDRFERVQRVSNTFNGYECGQGICFDPVEDGVMWWVSRDDVSKLYKIDIAFEDLDCKLLGVKFKDGYIGLGIELPQEKLHVIGRIRVDEAPINDKDVLRLNDLQSCPIPEDVLVLKDTTERNATLTRHGFCPKLSGSIEDFLRGDGEFAPPDGGGGGISHIFKDSFDDSSIYEAWVTHGTTSQKTITEDSSGLLIHIDQGVNANWNASVNNAPKIFIGAPTFPFIVTVKINSFTNNNLSSIFLWIGRPTNYGSSYFCNCGLRRADDEGYNGFFFQIAGSSVPEYRDNDYPSSFPVWIRLKVSKLTPYGQKIVFQKSTDGVNFITLYTFTTDLSTATYQQAIGLACNNWSENNLTEGLFGQFKIEFDSGPG